MRRRKRVLVLCTGNSCRSQMAQGWVNRDLGQYWVAHSAGTAPAARVHPLAVRVMAEAGIDISQAVPEHLDNALGDAWDLVVTVCDAASAACPTFPDPVETKHMSFHDPADVNSGTFDMTEITAA